MGTQTATLIAAALAALAAVTSLIVTTVAARRRESEAAIRAMAHERREVHRNAITPHLSALGGAIHEVVATSFVQQKSLRERKKQAAANWRDRGLAARDNLEVLRRELRYFLPGLDPGFKALIPLPNWVAHRSGSEEADEMLSRADRLATCLHEVIEDSWRAGEPPPKTARETVLTLATAVRAVAPIGPLLAAATDDEALIEATDPK